MIFSNGLKINNYNPFFPEQVVVLGFGLEEQGVWEFCSLSWFSFGEKYHLVWCYVFGREFWWLWSQFEMCQP